MALSKRKLSPYFLFGLLLLLAWVSLRIVGVFLDWVLVGLFLAYISYPAYEAILKRIKQRTVSALLMVWAVALVILAPLALLALALVRELENLLVAVNRRGFEAREAEWASSIDRLLDLLGLGASVDSRAVIEEAKQWITDRLADIARDLPADIVAGAIGVFVLLYVMYYTYTDGPKLMEYLRQALPMQESHRFKLFREVGNVVRAVMFGTVLTALIQAAIGGVGFVIFGVPGALLWTVVMFVLALLPIVGPPIVWVPAAWYLFDTGHTFAAVGLFFYSLILVSGIDNLIRPKLIGSRAQVHPVVILLGVLGGVIVFGAVGVLIGPLVLAIFVTIVDVYKQEFAAKMEDEDTSMVHL